MSSIPASDRPAVSADQAAKGSFPTRIATEPSDFEQAFAVRRAVFVGEQDITEAEEFDENDCDATHLLAESNGLAVGTLRIRDGGHKVAKIERVAVLATYRRTGIGLALLEHGRAFANDRGFVELVLAAQVVAVGFYERAGYRAEGDVFLEDRIEHRWMRRAT